MGLFQVSYQIGPGTTNTTQMDNEAQEVAN
ncbi:uncharacterized protein G2W53_031773 [Senna tora]|uniref:Uncharacterized protein n=1 Tax=Senna tora TaxID=362788 RepID=A0A834SZA8_9FABA|nr:uncharacterized protein G2W53_031773 [Senna tora]